LNIQEGKMSKILYVLQNRLFRKIKQKETGKVLGGIKTLIERSMSYVTVINFGLIAITAYHTTIHPIFPAIPFWGFFASLAIFVLGVIILEYIVVYPSEITFLAHQTWKEERNPMFGEIKVIKKELTAQNASDKAILEKLEKIEQALR